MKIPLDIHFYLFIYIFKRLNYIFKRPCLGPNSVAHPDLVALCYDTTVLEPVALGYNQIASGSCL